MSTRDRGEESEEEDEDDDLEVDAPTALEIGNRRDGDPVVECLQAMYGDATALAIPAKSAKKLAKAIVILFSTMALNHVFVFHGPTDEGNKFFLTNQAFMEIYSGNIKSDRYMKKEFFDKLPHGDLPGCVDVFVEHLRWVIITPYVL